MYQTINSRDSLTWRRNLALFRNIDVCHLPEYHNAYRLKHCDSEAILWTYTDKKQTLSYPFLLSPIRLNKQSGENIDTGFFDISSIYGFSGPLSTTNNRTFLDKAWAAFDDWAKSQKIICEFVRYSVFSNNHRLSHKDCNIEFNRPISISSLPSNSDDYFKALPAKTRNLIRRARKEGLVSKKLCIKNDLDEFINLYSKTMIRNKATDFFSYDQEYFKHLFQVPNEELSFHAVYKENAMVSASIGLIHGSYGFYHLGASEKTPSFVGAGNLVLFDMAKSFIEKDVAFFNVGGGRTTNENDALFKFKKNNGTDLKEYYIGKRILDSNAYELISDQWKVFNNSDSKPTQLQFYRSK